MTLAKDLHKLLNNPQDMDLALEFALQNPLENALIISNLTQLKTDCSIVVLNTENDEYSVGSYYRDLPFNNIALMARTKEEVKELIAQLAERYPELAEAPVYGLYDEKIVKLIEGNFRVANKTKELKMVLPTGQVPDILYDRSSYRLEKLTVQDIIQISHLYSLVPAMAWTPKALAFGPYYGLYYGEHLVSIAGVHFTTEWAAEIGNIVTHFKHRRQNLGYVCTKAVIENLRERCSNVFLCVIADNYPAVSLYEKMGFIIAEELYLTQFYL